MFMLKYSLILLKQEYKNSVSGYFTMPVVILKNLPSLEPRNTKQKVIIVPTNANIKTVIYP